MKIKNLSKVETVAHRWNFGLEIRDAALKQALFAIWLGDKPAQDSLKQALLGH